jgi:hypothetical protein
MPNGGVANRTLFAGYRTESQQKCPSKGAFQGEFHKSGKGLDEKCGIIEYLPAYLAERWRRCVDDGAETGLMGR